MKNKTVITLIMIISTIVMSIFAFVSFDRKNDEISIEWVQNSEYEIAANYDFEC